MSARSLKIFFLFVGDAVLLYAGLFLTLILRYRGAFYQEFVDFHLAPFSIIFILWLAGFYIAGLYDPARLRNNLDFFKTLSLAIAANTVFSVFLFYLIPAFGIAPKTNLIVFVFVFAVLETVWRRLFNRFAASGGAPNVVLMIGGGLAGEEVAAAIRDNPQIGYEMKAGLSEAAAYKDPEIITRMAREQGITMIVVPAHLKQEPRLVRTLYELFGRGVAVIDLPTFYETVMRKVPLGDLEETWFLENIAAEARFYDPLKRAIEFVAALALGIILLPLEILIALIVRLSSRGPAIYRQVRVGERGKKFTLYKFRSMRMDSEKDGPQWATENDRRATPFGNFLRTTHLDELPQLWNIIKGEISFVGPRPERPEFVEKLEKEIPYYEVRLLIKPGVTGWAQINYPHDKTVQDVVQKLQYDIYYLKNRSLVLDLAIMLRSIKLFVVNPE